MSIIFLVKIVFIRLRWGTGFFLRYSGNLPCVLSKLFFMFGWNMFRWRHQEWVKKDMPDKSYNASLSSKSFGHKTIKKNYEYYEKYKES